MKTCNRCSFEKPLSAFNRRGKGHQPYCKECQAQIAQAYYQGNREAYGTRRKRWKQELREWYVSLKDKPCTDCGQRFHHAAMQWDHLPGTVKEGSVQRVLTATASKEKVLAEIAKCELVCANCHAIRTYNRIEGVSPSLV